METILILQFTRPKLLDDLADRIINGLFGLEASRQKLVRIYSIGTWIVRFSYDES